MKTNVLIVGGGEKAPVLAETLLQKGYHVTALVEDLNLCEKLSNIEKLELFHGEEADPETLYDSGIDRMDVVIAMSRKDEDNLVICELSKQKFHVKRTIAMVNDPKNAEFFHKRGVDSALCEVAMITNFIEQNQLMDEMATLLPLGEGGIQIAQVRIVEDSPVVDRKIWEIGLPHEVIIGCILRGGASMVPRGDTRILANDTLILISSEEYEGKAIHVLTGR